VVLTDSPEARRLRYRENVTVGFDLLGGLYREYWGEHFHLAVYEDGDDASDFGAALARTHERYFQSIRGADAAMILDLACGGGALAEWMAERTTGTVLGVDLSSAQLAQARRRRGANLGFVQHDIMELESLGKGPFDAAICLDAFCYLPDRRRALRNVASVLAPGARFLLVDWCRSPRPAKLQSELILEPFYRAWGIADLETVDGYSRALASASMDIITIEDLSARVRPNWDRAYSSALAAVAKPIHVGRLAELLTAVVRHGDRAVNLAKDQFLVALLAKAAADSGLLRYVAIVAQPAGGSRSGH
jgi:sterol 24-C-methyltransferase